jgi:hypothetical protein
MVEVNSPLTNSNLSYFNMELFFKKPVPVLLPIMVLPRGSCDIYWKLASLV